MDRIAALVAALAHDDHATRLTAYHALNEAGVNALDAARGHARGNDRATRVNAASVLLVMGMDIGEALEVLTQALKSNDADLRHQAAFGLAVVGFVSADTISVLIEALRDRKVDARENAAISLARLAWQPVTDRVKPALVHALNDESPFVRRHAVYALCLRGGKGNESLKDLGQWLQDDSADVRQQVLMLLHQQFGGEAIPYLRDAFPDRNATIRWIAVFYLARSGPAARDALHEAARHADAAVRQLAEQALKSMENK